MKGTPYDHEFIILASNPTEITIIINDKKKFRGLTPSKKVLNMNDISFEFSFIQHCRYLMLN